jgi:hypothetical protein
MIGTSSYLSSIECRKFNDGVRLARAAEPAPTDAGAVPVQGGRRGRAGHPGRPREELVPHQVQTRRFYPPRFLPQLEIEPPSLEKSSSRTKCAAAPVLNPRAAACSAVRSAVRSAVGPAAGTHSRPLLFGVYLHPSPRADRSASPRP